MSSRSFQYRKDERPSPAHTDCALTDFPLTPDSLGRSRRERGHAAIAPPVSQSVNRIVACSVSAITRRSGWTSGHTAMPFCTCTDAGLITVTDDPACTRSGAAQLAPIDNASSGKPRPPPCVAGSHPPCSSTSVTTTPCRISTSRTGRSPSTAPYSTRRPIKPLPAMLECAGNIRSDLGPGIPGNPCAAST